MQHILPEFIRSLNNYHPAPRKMQLDYFLDPEVKESYRRDGYVIIKKVVTDEAITSIENTYEKVRQMNDFYEAPGFITSANFGPEVQRFVLESLKTVTDLVFPSIFDMDKIHDDLLNVLVIKYSNAASDLFPHQDMAMVDELLDTATFSWIPTTDINRHNGHLLVLPGSHLWGSWQRTYNQSSSPLEKQQKLLLKHMEPVYLKRGDLVLFDSALIHASAPNLSNEIRLAINACATSKNSSLVHYCETPSLPKGYIDRYSIDRAFFREHHYLHPEEIDNRYAPPTTEKLRCDFKINSRNLKKLIQSYKY